MGEDVTLAQLYRNFLKAGYAGERFWGLTPRLYAIEIHAALERLRLEMTMRNRTAWNTAALVGAAMAGKLPRYDEFFPVEAEADSKGPQTAEQLEVALRALAASWGALPPEGAEAA